MRFGRGGVRKMTTELLFEILLGVGKFFLHPLFYLSFLLCLFIGYLRVKRERRDFNTKIYNATYELKSFLPEGLFWGLLLSAVTVIAGIVLPMALIMMIAAVTLLLAVTTKVRILSPAYSLAISFIIIFAMMEMGFTIPIFTDYFAQLESSVYPGMLIVLGLLLIAEGYLIKRNSVKTISPQLMVSKRGQPVGVYSAQKVWLIPLFVLLPEGSFVFSLEWYPVFSIGDTYYAPILVPFLIGFAQKIQGSLPEIVLRAHGKQVILFGWFILIAAVSSYWYPVIAIGVAAIALLGREGIYYLHKSADRKQPFFFTESKQGVKILGIIPDSPAEKMGLEKGEVISKINGVAVKEERELYRSLQMNLAHCKLEVIGNNGEMRLVQRALFEGEHYELGLLFVKDQLKEREQAM